MGFFSSIPSLFLCDITQAFYFSKLITPKFMPTFYLALKSRFSFPSACLAFPVASLLGISNSNSQPHLPPPYLFSFLQKAPSIQCLGPKTLKSPLTFMSPSHSTSDPALTFHPIAHLPCYLSAWRLQEPPHWSSCSHSSSTARIFSTQWLDGSYEYVSHIKAQCHLGPSKYFSSDWAKI